jgi:hypothetical protein
VFSIVFRMLLRILGISLLHGRKEDGILYVQHPGPVQI